MLQVKDKVLLKIYLNLYQLITDSISLGYSATRDISESVSLLQRITDAVTENKETRLVELSETITLTDVASKGQSTTVSRFKIYLNLYH